MSKNFKDCQICSYKWTIKKRAKILCKNCKEECCLECYKNYILGGNFKCMFCNIDKDINLIIGEIEGNKPIIDKIFELQSGNFIKEDNKNVAKYLEYNKLQEEKKEKHESFEKELKNIHDTIWFLNEEADKIKNMRLIYENDFNQKIIKIKSLDYHKTYTNYKCFNSGCTGYLNHDFFCNLCKSYFCKKCNKQKQEAHGCSEEDLQTVKYIEQNTIPCPKCGERISKVTGCDQMYCDPKEGGIGCGTVFSYNTGKIQNNGHIHNPHYIERREKLNMDHPDFDIFTFTVVWDWCILFNNYDIPFSLDLKTLFHQLWDCRFKLVDKKQKYFSENTIQEEIFNIGIKNFNNEEEWKRNIKLLIKKKHNYSKLRELWQEVIESFEKKIYDLIEIFNKREITTEKLNKTVEDLFNKCSTINSRITEECKYVKVAKTYYVNFKKFEKRRVNCLQILNK